MTEIRDPEGLLSAYEKAKADLVALREENKKLIEQVEGDGMKNRALSAEAKLALKGLGVDDVDRLMPYIGTDALDFDENGAVVGLTERLDTLKKDLPEVFNPKVKAGGKANIFENDNVEVRANPLRQAVHQALN